MRSTLGLVGDGDDLDLLADLERCFGIGITNSEAASLQTVGDIYGLLLRRFAASNRNAGGCASAMAFYRLRGALSKLAPTAKLRPDTPLNDVTDLSPKRLLRTVSGRSGLQLRAVGGLLARAGTWLVSLAALGLLPVLLVEPGAWSVPVAAGVAGALLIRCDRGRFPRGCATLGDLAREAAARNLGRLTIEGAQPRRKDLWSALVAVLSDHSALSRTEIRSEMRLLGKRVRSA